MRAQRWRDGLAGFFGRRLYSFTVTIGVFVLVGLAARVAGS